MTQAEKIKLVNRVSAVVGGALIVAVLAHLLATGSPLAGTFLLGGAGVFAGYGLVHLVSGALGTPRTSRGRFAWTTGMALVMCSSVFANAAVGEGLYTAASSAPAELLADGFLFGTFFGAGLRLFPPPSEGDGPGSRDGHEPIPRSD